MSTNNEGKREQIIAAAKRRFAHYGFSKTAMNEIAEDLKMTKANLYYYYSDKDKLIHDVISTTAKEYEALERELIAQTHLSTIALLSEILQLKSNFIKRHYMLHMNENLEWIKGASLQALFKDLQAKEVLIIREILSMGIRNEEIVVEDVDKTAQIYVEIMKSLGLAGTLSDMLTGIPTLCNSDEILRRQMDATQLIYKGLKKQ